MSALSLRLSGYQSFLCLFLALISIHFLSCTAQAQGGGGVDSSGTGGRHIIQGRIYFPSGRTADLRAKVKLETTISGNLSVLADLDGAFKFTNLGSGSYDLIVDAGNDYENYRETIYIEGNSSIGRGMRISTPPRTVIVPVYLQVKRLQPTAKPGVINAALSEIPKAAADLYLNALQSLKAGDNKRAISQLQGAVSLYPNFSLALNELGVQFLKIGDSAKAVDVLQRAARLSPESVTPRLNFGIALLEQKRFPEAQAELREVLKINENVATAHLYLGITLLNLRDFAEAEKELQRAALSNNPELSVAHYYLAGVYWRNRDYKRAVDELEKYLQANPNAPDAERTRATIAELRAKQKTD